MSNQSLDNTLKNHYLLDEILITPSNQFVDGRFNPENIAQAAACGSACGAGCGGGCGSGGR